MSRVGIILLIILLLPLIQPYLASAEVSYGYIVIEDAAGRVWTLDDVRRLYNTSYNGYSLGGTFHLVIDNRTVLNLNDTVEYNGMAAWNVSAGRHNYTIVWFGYRQSGVVDVPSNNYIIIRLNTAPFLPLDYVNSTDNDLWSVTTNPLGLEYKYNDFKVWFQPGSDTIVVHRYDPVSKRYVNSSFVVYVNGGYTWTFHLPQLGQYDYSESGGFWWFKWDVIRIHEEARINTSSRIKILSYAVLIGHNKELYESVGGLLSFIVRYFGLYWIEPTSLKTVASAPERIYNDIISILDTAVDAYVAMVHPSTEGVMILYEVISGTTITVVVARAYNFTTDSSGNVVSKNPIPIYSPSAITFNNTAIAVYAIYGGYSYSFNDDSLVLKAYLPSDTSSNYAKSIYIIPGAYPWAALYKSSVPDSYYKLYLPGGKYVRMHGDISEIGGYVFLSFRVYKDSGISLSSTSKIELNITFDDSSDADFYELNLKNYNIPYTRDGTVFTITIASDSYQYTNDQVSRTALLWGDVSKYTKYARHGSFGYLSVKPYVEYKIGGGYTNSWLKISHIHYDVVLYPRIEPVTAQLYQDGYTFIGSAYGVRLIGVDFYVNDTWYIPGYYVFSNPPKRPLILTYDVELDNATKAPITANITYLLIDKEFLHIGEVLNTSLILKGDNSTPTTYYITVEFIPRLDPVFQDVIIGFYSIWKMSFLHLDIHALMSGVPLYKDYGLYIWSWPERKYVLIYGEKTVTRLIQETKVEGITYYFYKNYQNFINNYILPPWKALDNILGALDWLYTHRWWILLGLAAFFILIIMIMAAGATRPYRLVVSK